MEVNSARILQHSLIPEVNNRFSIYHKKTKQNDQKTTKIFLKQFVSQQNSIYELLLILCIRNSFKE
jgi:hypothetical protein